MNILSCFDGMSCGQIALNRMNIHYDNYYASEIDKYCLKVTQHHYPDTIQLGDITKWKNWNLPPIDLIVGGSPCQGFSFAGKGLNFDDERSKLFFVFVDILKYYKPKFFLLENVKMKKEWEHIITCYLGIKPIEINSALVSAQNRKRLYWTNIPVRKLPDDKHIYLKDIIENGEVDRQKSYTIDVNYYKGGSLKNYLKKCRRQITPMQSEKRLMVGRIVNRKINEFGKRDDYNESLDLEPYIEVNKSGKSNNLSTVNKDNILIYPMALRTRNNIKQPETRLDNKANSLTGVQTDSMLRLIATKRGQDRKGQRIYSTDGKFSSIDAIGESNGFTGDNITWRKLTPIECERLQTVPDCFTKVDGVSNTRRYMMLGNGWTVDVIAHILKYLPKNLDNYEPYILPDYKPNVVKQERLF